MKAGPKKLSTRDEGEVAEDAMVFEDEMPSDDDVASDGDSASEEEFVMRSQRTRVIRLTCPLAPRSRLFDDQTAQAVRWVLDLLRMRCLRTIWIVRMTLMSFRMTMIKTLSCQPVVFLDSHRSQSARVWTSSLATPWNVTTTRSLLPMHATHFATNFARNTFSRSIICSWPLLTLLILPSSWTRTTNIVRLNLISLSKM